MTCFSLLFLAFGPIDDLWEDEVKITCNYQRTKEM